MSERTALLQAVIEAPDDDVPRLVFADWLEEHGEAERSEFIRVQCEIARMNGTEGERLAALASREKELWKTHGVTWRSDLPKWARARMHFRRGFPTSLCCTQTQWLDARGLLQRAPIESLALSNCKPNKLAAFAATAHLQRVRALRVPAEDASMFQALSQSACAPGLRVLDLRRYGDTQGCTSGDTFAAALVVSNLPALQCLHLSRCGIGPAGALELADWPSLSGVRKLDLAGNPIGVEGARALAQSPLISNLTALGLCKCRITDRGVEALVGSPHLGRLTHLNLSFGNLTVAAAQAVAASPYLTRLTVLDLYSNDIGDAGLRTLLKSPYLTRLKTLDLGGNSLTAKGLWALARAPGMKSLERLGLVATPNVEKVVSELKASPNLPRLRDVSVEPNWVENATGQEIDEHFQPLHGETLMKRL